MMRAEMDLRTSARWIERWARGEPIDDARLRRVWSFAQLLSVVVFAPFIVKMLAPITSAPHPARLQDGPGDVRYGLDLAARKAIFAEVAATEPHSREQGVAGFPGQPWSQEDHRAAFERDAVRSIAARRGLNLTQIYLVLDEGIRSQWPGPDGKPLRATSVPLDPRRK